MITKVKNKFVELFPESSEVSLKVISKFTESITDDAFADIPFSKILKYYIELNIDIADINKAYRLAISFSVYLTMIESLEKKYKQEIINEILDEEYLKNIFNYVNTEHTVEEFLFDHFYSNKIIDEILMYYSSFLGVCRTHFTKQ